MCVGYFLQNCSLGIVGKDVKFTIFDDEKVKPYLDAIEGDSRATNAGQDDPPQPPPSGSGADDGTGPRQPPRDPQVNVLMESMEH